jgi:hypothetical protein
LGEGTRWGSIRETGDIKMRLPFAALVCTLAFGGAATGALAQDPGARATAGSISVREGFTPDPIEVEIYSGGDIDASRLGGGCIGLIAKAPDYKFEYRAGRSPLTFAVAGDADTSLVINGPDGRWYCTDDDNGLDPIFSFSRPQSGTYDVWVGAVGDAGSSTLLITEMQ